MLITEQQDTIAGDSMSDAQPVDVPPRSPAAAASNSQGSSLGSFEELSFNAPPATPPRARTLSAESPTSYGRGAGASSHSASPDDGGGGFAALVSNSACSSNGLSPPILIPAASSASSKGSGASSSLVRSHASGSGELAGSAPRQHFAGSPSDAEFSFISSGDLGESWGARAAAGFGSVIRGAMGGGLATVVSAELAPADAEGQQPTLPELAEPEPRSPAAARAASAEAPTLEAAAAEEPAALDGEALSPLCAAGLVAVRAKGALPLLPRWVAAAAWEVHCNSGEWSLADAHLSEYRLLVRVLAPEGAEAGRLRVAASLSLPLLAVLGGAEGVSNDVVLRSLLGSAGVVELRFARAADAEGCRRALAAALEPLGPRARSPLSAMFSGAAATAETDGGRGGRGSPGLSRSPSDGLQPPDCSAFACAVPRAAAQTSALGSSFVRDDQWEEQGEKKERLAPGPLEQALATGRWRRSAYTAECAAVESYPATCIVPHAVTDAEVGGSARFRVRGRFPALSYYDCGSGAAVVRSSQPMPGVTFASSAEDQALLRGVWGAAAAERANAADSAEPPPPLLVLDCRSRAAAYANQVGGGGGVESASHYQDAASGFAIEV